MAVVVKVKMRARPDNSEGEKKNIRSEKTEKCPSAWEMIRDFHSFNKQLKLERLVSMLRHFKKYIQPRAKELGATLLNVVEAFF